MLLIRVGSDIVAFIYVWPDGAERSIARVVFWAFFLSLIFQISITSILTLPKFQGYKFMQNNCDKKGLNLNLGLAKPQALWTLPFLSFVLLNLFIFMGFDILLPTLSLYLESHGHSEIEIGRIFAAFTVSAVITRLLASRMASRLDALWLVRIGLLGCALAGIWYFWAHTFVTGLAARFLHGAGFGLASTLITALASQIIPPARMGEGMGYLGLGTTLALALGPFLGIWLMNEFGYLVMFIAVSSFYLAAIIMVSCLPKIKLSSSDPTLPRPKLTLVSRKALAPSFLTLLLGVIMSAVFFFLPLFCKEKGLNYAGHFFVLSTIGLFISRMSAGRIHDRFGHKYVIIPSGLALLGTMLLLAQVESREMLFTLSIIYGLGTGAAFPSLQALALSLVPQSGRTEATASFFNSFDIGIGVGGFALGYLANITKSYGAVFTGAAAASALLVVFYVVFYLVIKPRGQVKK